jgi:hypothetical protein
MTGRREVWMAISSFGEDAVASVVGDKARDLGASLTNEELMAIARVSRVPYWSDGTRLWTIEYGPRNASPISPADALARFGLEALEEAREKGSWPP